MVEFQSSIGAAYSDRSQVKGAIQMRWFFEGESIPQQVN
jgi:hypothetical protein